VQEHSRSSDGVALSGVGASGLLCPCMPCYAHYQAGRLYGWTACRRSTSRAMRARCFHRWERVGAGLSGGAIWSGCGRCRWRGRGGRMTR